jgi:hypothetical protein
MDLAKIHTVLFKEKYEKLKTGQRFLSVAQVFPPQA